MQIIYRRVHNYAKSRQGNRPEAIVIHMAEDNAEAALDKFNDSLLRNSAHYLVTREGKIWRLVEETDTAWHAGGAQKPTWKLIKPELNPNLYTIGIVHEGKSGEPWSEAMYRASAGLIANVTSRWEIKLDRDHIIGHSEINSLHNDPGLGVDLDKLIALAGNLYKDELSSVVDEESKSEANLRNRLSTMELSLLSLQAENKKLKAELGSVAVQSSEEMHNQNLAMSEELYSLQQQHNELKLKYNTLQTRYQDMTSERVSYLHQFSTRQLLSAIIKRLRNRN